MQTHEKCCSPTRLYSRALLLYENFYLDNLVDLVFATLSNHELANSCAMPRACVLVSKAIVSTLISELTTKDVCAVIIEVFVGDSKGNTSIVRRIDHMINHPQRMISNGLPYTAQHKAFFCGQ